MPSLVGRLTKHSNRSQHAIPTAEAPPAFAGGAPPAQGSGAGLGSGSGLGSGAAGPPGTVDDSAGPVAARSSPLQSARPASTESFDAHLLSAPHQQPQPPPQLYSSQHSLSPLPNPPGLVAVGGSRSSVVDGRQPPPQTPASLGRCRPQLQQEPPPPPPPPQQQQQLAYLTSSGSVDDLAAAASHRPSPAPPAAPEKRSTRKLIRGIFSSSGRSGQDASLHQGHSSHDNTAGLARRPSKRAGTPPVLKTSLSQPTQYAPDRDWLAQDSYSQLPSPLQGVGEFDGQPYPSRPSGLHFVPHDFRIAPAGTAIHQEPGQQIEASPCADDDAYQSPDYPPPRQQQPPLQRRGTLHVQDQQTVHDPQQQQPEPRIITSHLGSGPQQNPETVSQLSHESPVTEPDQASANQSPAVSPAQPQDAAPTAPRPPLSLASNSQSLQQPAMAPPGGASTPSRRLDTEKTLRGQVEPPAGPPPGYRHGSVPMNPVSPLPPPSGQGGAQGQNPAYRGDRASQYEGAAGGDQGRNSPQPSNSDRDAEGEKQFKDLLTKYKNVKRLYFDGKSQIEQLTSQVEQLQNAVANQRMSQSRTAWDDNEYTTRFNRLNGAINNLSFNIRKDWRSLPPWLEGYVSADALKTGKQEMTAVGRAIVSRWVVEEVFNKCFHPGLDAQLSSQLKEIELGIRGNAYTMHSQEEFDALTTKVVNWRMATLEGLQKKLGSPATGEKRERLMSKATTDLTAFLHQHLSSPPPAGVEGSTSMIAELAVAIATNLPLESRDVAIMYPLPGDAVQPHVMEVEKPGLPALDAQRTESEDEDEDETDRDKDKKTRGRGDKARAGPAKDGSSKVRFAGFVALEVRGRQVLMKAPVWTV